MKKNPAVSVIMAIYNGGEYLCHAVESILGQTFYDFEFIITNDGSTDDTPYLLENYARRDSRISVINQANKGLTECLNNMIKMARGEFVARMDADDISLPERLEKQISKLRTKPDYLAVGSWFQTLNEDSTPNYEIFFPDRPDVFKHYLHRGVNCFAHGSIMLRREILHDRNLTYRFKYGQDFDLWLRLSECGPIGVVEEVLYKRRDHSNTVSNSLVPQRAVLMRLMLALANERRTHGKEISDWRRKEMEILNDVPLWTEKEINAYNLFLEARSLLCAGRTVMAREKILLAGNDLDSFDKLKTIHKLTFLPGIIIGPILRWRDKKNDSRYFKRRL